jgi:hypothetical protein
MKLPRYCVVGNMPVRAVRTKWWRMDVQALNRDTGEFERAMQFLTAVVHGGSEVDFVTESEFEQAVSKFRSQLKKA